MPDHLHLLLSGKMEISDLQKAIKSFKQKSGYIFFDKYKKKLWHTSYYDHILRKDESITEIIKYILNNPVRKNLVASFKEYPFSGSLVFNINDL